MLKNKKVYGTGITDIKMVDYEGSILKSYLCWKSMLRRCLSDKFKNTHKTYSDCVVSNDWLLYSTFKTWYDKKYIDGYQLDKDVICVGNKIYSEHTCCFLPPELNSLIQSHTTKNDGYTGVTYYPKNRKLVCRVSSSLLDKKRCVGLFDTKEEAWEQYKNVKSSRIKEAALKYKDIIDERAFNNLINWRI